MDSPSGGGNGISLAFPAGAGFKKLVKGEPILIDVAFSYEGYIVDCTRIFSLGKPSPKFMQAHDISGECHSLFYDILTNGASIPEIYKKISSQVDRYGLADVFMGNVKFIGHGVGLELDEYPILTENFEATFQDGMVIAFEPKFVFRDGTVGFENTYYIRDGKPESVSNFSESINVF
jgi:Xaa-Pro aminopeptidase